jgi:hypothetical protein
VRSRSALWWNRRRPASVTAAAASAGQATRPSPTRSRSRVGSKWSEWRWVRSAPSAESTLIGSLFEWFLGLVDHGGRAAVDAEVGAVDVAGGWAGDEDDEGGDLVDGSEAAAGVVEELAENALLDVVPVLAPAAWSTRAKTVIERRSSAASSRSIVSATERPAVRTIRSLIVRAPRSSLGAGA